jgi:hypothetical protein
MSANDGLEARLREPTQAQRIDLTRLLAGFGYRWAIRFRADGDGVQAVPWAGGDPIYAATPGEMGGILTEKSGGRGWPS